MGQVRRLNNIHPEIEAVWLKLQVQFMHLDPTRLFELTEGRVITPQQTEVLYRQLAWLDVSTVRMSGCMSNWWFCSRWRTGQRLLNMLSVGVPSVVWGDAQGHLDIINGLWPRSSAP